MRGKPYTPEEDAAILACPVTPRAARRSGKPTPMQLLSNKTGRSESALRSRKYQLVDAERARRDAENRKRRQRDRYRNDAEFRRRDNERTRENQRRRRRAKS